LCVLVFYIYFTSLSMTDIEYKKVKAKIPARLLYKSWRKIDLETLSAQEAIGTTLEEFSEFFKQQPADEDIGWDPVNANIAKAYELRELIASRNKKKRKVENKFANEIFQSTYLPFEIANEVSLFMLTGCGRIVKGKPCGGSMDHHVQFMNKPVDYTSMANCVKILPAVEVEEWICDFHYSHYFSLGEGSIEHKMGVNRLNFNYCSVCEEEENADEVGEGNNTAGVVFSDYYTGFCSDCVKDIECDNDEDSEVKGNPCCFGYKFKCNACWKSLCDGHSDSCDNCPYSIIRVDDSPKYCNDCSMEYKIYKDCLNCVFDRHVPCVKKV